MTKPILCLDFDGVIHGYQSGWQGARIIPDPPVPGAIHFAVAATERFTVAIYSSRSSAWFGRRAMQKWLHHHLCMQCLPDFEATPQWLAKHIDASLGSYIYDEMVDQSMWRLVRRGIQWPTSKPPALVTIDDRAIQFNGSWPSLDEVAEFKPWNKR